VAIIEKLYILSSKSLSVSKWLLSLCRTAVEVGAAIISGGSSGEFDVTFIANAAIWAA